MNSFLSTTTRRETGKFFAESSTTGTDSIKRILFEFDIDSQMMNAKPFANVRHLSHFADEDEVLISLGTIFRIKDMKFNNEQNLWIAKLELCSSDDFALKEIFEHERKLMQPTPSLLHLGKLLGNMGSYEKQKALIQQILNESEDALEKENCYLLLGQSARFLKDYDVALENNFKCLELQEKAGVDGLYIGQTSITIAEVHCLKLELDLTLEYAKKSLSLIPEDHLLRANAYRLMGKTHSKKSLHMRI
jgi:tetratricopeptide (TPR) repeat protein